MAAQSNEEGGVGATVCHNYWNWHCWVPNIEVVHNKLIHYKSVIYIYHNYTYLYIVQVPLEYEVAFQFQQLQYHNVREKIRYADEVLAPQRQSETT